MKKLLLPFLFLISFYASAQTTVIDSIYCGGVYRNYRLYVPAAYNGSTAWPLILNIHGYTSNAAAEQSYTMFGPIADTAHFLMVYPNATVISGQPTWNSGFGLAVDDIGFLSNLIDSLSASYNIDQNAVYSCGMSNGGYMSHTLACALSNKIVAIASVTGTMTPYQRSICSPGRAVPMMQIHGTADPTVPYSGSTYSLAIDTVVKYWVVNNGCNPTPVTTSVPDLVPGDGCTATHYVYNGGAMGSTVEFYKINGGAHTWPHTFPIGTTCQDFNASEAIWLFFRKYRMNMFVGVSEMEHNSYVLMYPNPVSNTLTIELDKFNSVVITDMTGREVLRSDKNQIDVSGLANGIYNATIMADYRKSVRKIMIKN